MHHPHNLSQKRILNENPITSGDTNDPSFVKLYTLCPFHVDPPRIELSAERVHLILYFVKQNQRFLLPASRREIALSE